jgi:hypothetical protein
MISITLRPATEEDTFQGVQNTSYWTATTDEQGATNVYAINSSDGEIPLRGKKPRFVILVCARRSKRVEPA